MNAFSRTVWQILLIAVLFMAGCNRGQTQQTSTLAFGPDVNTFAVTNQYTADALEATGGSPNWSKTRSIRSDCVVTFYRPDGSFHLTEQTHEIYPWSDSVRISAEEPQGDLVWQVSQNVAQGMEKIDRVSDELQSRHFAEAILQLTTAPVRLCDKRYFFTEKSQPVKIEGLWYDKIEKKVRPYGQMIAADANEFVSPYWSEVVFYKNAGNSLVDIVWFANTDEMRFLIARGYDYRKLKGKDILLPAKIEIFNSDSVGTFRKRFVKIDYYSN